MADIENTPVEQLCYTWSDVGLSTVYAGFRIRAASPGLTEIYSERVKSMDRYMRYVLPPGTDRFAIEPNMAPVCLAFVRTEWDEYILVHKNYVGEDGVGRLGNFFVHLFALGKPLRKFSAANAICFWASNIWKTSDTEPHLKRSSNQLETITLNKLKKSQHLHFNFAQVQSYLPFIIEAYLTRQQQQPIYIAAPADSTEMIVSLIVGLTDCLPKQLLRDLTFSTYESDVTKATTQIVGTSWITTPGKEGFAEQVFTPQFCRDRLAVNCYTGVQSTLKGHPLTTNSPLVAKLAPDFARYAAHCLVSNDVESLYDFLDYVEKDPALTIESFLQLYSREIVHKGNVSQEVIYSDLANPAYQIEKLSNKKFRDSILDAVTNNSQSWQAQLRPLLLRLREQIAKENGAALRRVQNQIIATSTEVEQDQKQKVSAQGPRRESRKKADAQQKVSLTLGEALPLLAKDAIPRIVSTMEQSFSLGEVATNQNTAYEVARIMMLLDVMSCSLLPKDPTEVWKDLLDSILRSQNACNFLKRNWNILEFLLKQWNIVFPPNPEYDKQVSRLLAVPWSHLGEFLKLHLWERHSEWNVFAVDELIRDASLTSPIAQHLEQNYGEEITELLTQLSQEQRWWVRAAQFATKLSNNDYPGKPKYYDLIEELLGFLVKIPQYRLLAKDLVAELTLSGYSGPASYLRHVETLLSDLLKNEQQEQKEGMDLFNTLIRGYDKERFAPIVLQANLGLVKQVYPTQNEQAMFFASKGSQYLSTSEEVHIMSNLYSELLNYSGRPQRLVVILHASMKESSVLNILRNTPLGRDERVLVLKTYGKVYLQDYQHSPALAQFVVDSFLWLVQSRYPAKELLFALFTSAASPHHLEALLASAPLSGEESAEFFETYGSLERYFPFFYRSPATLTLLTNLAQAKQFSATKMQVVFSWLAPSRLRLSLRPEDVGEILQAAVLTDAERAQFLEQYGQAYLPLYRQLPLILEYVGNYISTFTTAALDRSDAKKFVAFLWQTAPSLPLDAQTQQYIRYWGTINQYFEAPTAVPGTLQALAAALSSLGLPNDSAFEAKLASAFAQCIRDKDGLVTIMQYVELIPKINSPQLLYSLAEERANLYRQQIGALLPCLLFVLGMPDLYQKQQHFTQQFLDRLLHHVNDLAIWRNLDRYVKNQNLPEAALKRWKIYLHWLELDKVTSDQGTTNGSDTSKVSQAVDVLPSASRVPSSRRSGVVERDASSPSRQVPLHRWWDYGMAETLIDAALKSKKVDRIAKTWARYGASIDEFYPEKISEDEREQIMIATQFMESCHVADEQPNVAYEQHIVHLANQINKLSLKCTSSQEDRIALAQRRLQAAGVNPLARSSSGSLPGKGNVLGGQQHYQQEYGVYQAEPKSRKKKH